VIRASKLPRPAADGRCPISPNPKKSPSWPMGAWRVDREYHRIEPLSES